MCGVPERVANRATLETGRRAIHSAVGLDQTAHQ